MVSISKPRKKENRREGREKETLIRSEISSRALMAMVIKIKSPWVAMALLFCLTMVFSSLIFFQPDVASQPADFQKGDPLLVKVSKLTSMEAKLPWCCSYYSLPYCKPHGIVDSAEVLGEIFRFHRIKNSSYVFEMRKPQLCQIVCKIRLNEKDAKELKKKIEKKYRVNMILDNLPVVEPIRRLDRNEPLIYQHGFYVGYHRKEKNLVTIVRFEVKPYSVEHMFEGDWYGNKTRLTTCDPHSKQLVTDSSLPQEVEANKEIIFSYDVAFMETNVKRESISDKNTMWKKSIGGILGSNA